MRATLVIAAMLAGGPATAGERDVPIGNICAGLRTYTLETTRDVSNGWLRAVIADGRFLGENGKIHDAAARLVWDVRCSDGRLAEAGRTRNRAEADELAAVAAVGTGEWPSVHCAPDQAFPGVAEMICNYHAKAAGENK